MIAETGKFQVVKLRNDRREGRNMQDGNDLYVTDVVRNLSFRRRSVSPGIKLKLILKIQNVNMKTGWNCPGAELSG
jgi:hypothetical protein